MWALANKFRPMGETQKRIEEERGWERGDGNKRKRNKALESQKAINQFQNQRCFKKKFIKKKMLEVETKKKKETKEGSIT